MSWDLETSDEFVVWYEGLNDAEVESVNFSVDLLEKAGPLLGRPHVDTLKGSRIPNLKELRVQHQGRPIRILFAFDPRRIGYLILGVIRLDGMTGMSCLSLTQRRFTRNICWRLGVNCVEKVEADTARTFPCAGGKGQEQGGGGARTAAVGGATQGSAVDAGPPCGTASHQSRRGLQTGEALRHVSEHAA